MLRKIREPKGRWPGGAVAIVASQYNARYVDAMVRAARAVLRRAGVPPRRLRVVRVPGAFEIPLAAQRLARGAMTGPRPAAILCLGVILRGQTAHAAHLGDTVSRALMDIQLAYDVPIIHEVLLLENHEQARVRCLSARHNRGAEAAQTALAMARASADQLASD